MTHDPQDASAFAEEMFDVNLTQKQINRFWGKIQKSDGDGCRDWLKGKDGKGYGAVSFFKKNYVATRICYFLTYGTFPNRLFVLHKCDRPSCCNPNHLFLGDHQDNMTDMVRKGRSPKAEKHPRKISPELWSDAPAKKSKLTIEQVRYIRSERENRCKTLTALADMFGVTKQSISAIAKRKIWRDLP